MEQQVDSLFQQTQRFRLSSCLEATADREFAKEMMNMGLDGTCRDREVLSHLLVRESLSHEA
jgi:hypothetical protein